MSESTTSGLKVDVLTPERALPSMNASRVNAPGVYGYVEILHNHAPYITELDVGVLKVDNQTFFVSGGYLEVLQNDVKILADIIEKPEDIDSARAEAARGRALKRLQDMSSGDEVTPLDIVRAQQALKRAQTRIDFKLISGASH